MAKFRSKPSIVDAIRWYPTEDSKYTYTSCFHHQTGLQLSQYYIQLPSGEKIINSGDWIIESGFGELFVMSDEIFRQKYEAISDEARYLLNDEDKHENN